MTRMAQVSIAELIERRVPLSVAEAVVLTLAVSDAARDGMPDDTEIVLSSTGQVSCNSVHPTASQDTPQVRTPCQARPPHTRLSSIPPRRQRSGRRLSIPR